MSQRETLKICLLQHTVQELVQLAGVSEHQAICARGGRPVSADAYLRLCIAVELDPAPEIPNPPLFLHPGHFDHVMLGIGTRATRIAKKHPIRAAAEIAGISLTTFSRMENGIPVSIENVLAACRYVNAHPFGYIVFHMKQRLNSLTDNDVSKTAEVA